MPRLRGERWERIGPVGKLETFLLGRRTDMAGDPEARGNWHPKELIDLESRQGMGGWHGLEKLPSAKSSSFCRVC